MRRISILPVLVLFSLIALLAVPVMTVAQVPVAADYNYYINRFETSATDSSFIIIGEGTPHATLTNVTSTKEGSKCLNVRWFLNSDQSWGGFLEVQHMMPMDTVRNPYHQYIDWGTGKYLSLWYNNITPNHFAGMNHFRFTIHEGGSGRVWSNPASGNPWEDWIYETTDAADIFDSTPGWRQLLIPLKQIGQAAPDQQGFSLPGWAGENPPAGTGAFEPDRIIGYSLIVSSTTAYPGGTTMVDSGTIQFDGLQLVGYASTPLEKFDAVPAWTGHWGNGVGTIVTTDTTDQAEGTKSVKFNYLADFADNWGSAVNTEIKYAAGSEVDWTTKKNVVFYFKNIVANPIDSISKRLTLRFILFDKASSQEEDWFATVPIKFGTVNTDWVQVQIPLVKIDSLDNSWNLKPYGFETAPGQPQDDHVFNLNKIGGYKIEISGDATGAYGTGVIQGKGSFLLDFIGGTGVKQADQTPPAAPTGVAAVTSKYQNVVTWNDVAGEAKSKYNVFYSAVGPITNVKAADVEDLPPYNIPVGTGFTSHVLRSAVKDTLVSFWYGVVATDSAGNVGTPGTSAKVTNTAQGVPTISKVAPANFTVDANMTEWVAAGIKPIRVSRDSATAHQVPNTIIKNDADCSVLAYIAVDATNLYVAMDVTDDFVIVDTLTDSYKYDSPDLFIGLYDFRGAKHGGYTRGAHPDYHFRFNFNSIRIDNDGVGNIMKVGANYAWKKKSLGSSGYTCEARIPWTTISGAIPGDVTFVPREGMRIPIDFSINDADDAVALRKGILCYSPLNDDNSWQDQYRWSYTWIGSKMTSGVEQTNDLPKAYELTQNYPNPFNPTTNISYNLEKAGMVSLKVYDILGREVSTLVNEMQNPGTYKVSFDGSASGKSLASGVYFYKLQAGSFSSTKKMMLLK